MNVALIGLGKLGLPVACAWASSGHTVYGYDTDSAKLAQYRQHRSGLYEPDFDNLLRSTVIDEHLILCDDLIGAVEPSDIVFIAVPTPSRSDDSFNTSIVKDALREVARTIQKIDDGRYRIITVISTVLPETCRGELLPLLASILGSPTPKTYGFCYNALLIAMGSVVDDELNPEFVLIGEYDKASGDKLTGFYKELFGPEVICWDGPPICRMSLENAEIVKMTYNTFVGLKIIYGNTVMELADKIPHADCDTVMNTLVLAHDRLISPKYLRGGLGDGGACHARDNRALSFLAKKLHLSVDPFSFVMSAREEQTDYIARLALKEYVRTGLPVVQLGATFKPHTNLTIDSPALLFTEMLSAHGLEVERIIDPTQDDYSLTCENPAVFVIGTAWPQWKKFAFPSGSVIIDPWRMLDRVPEGCQYRPVGVGSSA